MKFWKRRELVDLVRLDAGDHAERAHDAAAGDGVRERPQRMRERHVDEPDASRRTRPRPPARPRAHRREQIREEKLAVRKRRQQHEDDVARHLRLHEARRAVGERVLQHRHHREPRHQKGACSRRPDRPPRGRAACARTRADTAAPSAPARARSALSLSRSAAIPCRTGCRSRSSTARDGRKRTCARHSRCTHVRRLHDLHEHFLQIRLHDFHLDAP